jgi:hypothetical protein
MKKGRRALRVAGGSAIGSWDLGFHWDLGFGHWAIVVGRLLKRMSHLVPLTRVFGLGMGVVGRFETKWDSFSPEYQFIAIAVLGSGEGIWCFLSVIIGDPSVADILKVARRGIESRC